MDSRVVVITGAPTSNADLIDHPRAEAFTAPHLAETQARYLADVDAFERLVRLRASSGSRSPRAEDGDDDSVDQSHVVVRARP